MSDVSRLKDLLGQRFKYFNKYSNFDKCSSCSNTCCSQPISVDVSFVDLLSLSLMLQSKPSSIFKKFCRIGIHRDLDVIKQNSLAKFEVKVSLELVGPCPFLRENQCSIYSNGSIGRPASCSIFPEILSIHKTFDVDRKTFNEFNRTINYYSKVTPCVLDNHIPHERGIALLILNKFIFLEQAVTQLLALGSFPLIICLKEFCSSSDYDFKEFFEEEQVMSQTSISSVSKLNEEVGKYVLNTHPHIQRSLNFFLNSLDEKIDIYTAILEKIIKSPNALKYSSSVQEISTYYQLDQLIKQQSKNRSSYEQNIN